MTKYSKEERLKIGRKIYESGMSFIEAGLVYGFSDDTAKRYQLAYEQYRGVEHHAGSKLSSKPSAQINKLDPKI